jgi:hypothetical protein
VERRHQDREGGGGKQRAAEPLQGTERNQRGRGPREAAKQRAAGKQTNTGHEDTAAAEHVCEPAAEQQSSAEEDRVCSDDPLQALLREVEVGLDRRQRHVHDRDVEDHHELRKDDEHERSPMPALSDFRVRGVNHLSPPKIVDRANYVADQRWSGVHLFP